MKQTKLFILLAGMISSVALSQERYKNPVVNEIITETHTYISKEGQNLDMDIYMPANEPNKQRPALIYVHGGGFQNGRRNTTKIKKFCTRLAKYGYVVTSVSYRLTRKNMVGGFGCNCPVDEKINTFHAAKEDIQDASFFLIENCDYFGINPKKMILAGSSAGAETVLVTAYQPSLFNNSNKAPHKYAGVIGMAGAIPDTSVIDRKSAVPTLLFHGTDDNLVPYSTAPHHYCEKGQPGYFILHGSFTIAQKLAQLNIPYWLHTTCGGGHEMANIPMTHFFDEIVAFCFDFVINKTGKACHTVLFREHQQKSQYKQFNFCQQ